MQTRHDERASLALATALGERAKSLVRRPPVADERLAQASPGGSLASEPFIDYDGSRFYPDAEPPDECFASLTVGPAHDPYSTHCDLKPGHYPSTRHAADCPFGTDRRVEWRGGGTCAGDPLPVRDVEWIAV